MDKKIEVTVITPTYNRLAELPNLLKSLEKQRDKRFKWVVVDDGSNDGTEEWFKDILQQSRDFLIEYYKQENSGKHVALNHSHQYIEGKYTVVVDSDDELTENAIETIIATWERYENQSVKLIVFQRGRKLEGHKPFDPLMTEEEEVSTLVEKINQGMRGDHCETVLSEDFKKIVFPVFPHEKFMGEAWLWNKIAENGKTVFVNKVIYLCEYLEGGLSLSGRAMRLKYPYGGMEHAKVYMNKKFKLSLRFKQAILYTCYSFLAKKKFTDCFKESGDTVVAIITYPLGWILCLYWKIKYNYKET